MPRVDADFFFRPFVIDLPAETNTDCLSRHAIFQESRLRPHLMRTSYIA